MKRLIALITLGLSLTLPNVSEAQHGGGGGGHGGGGGGYHGGGYHGGGGGGYHGGGYHGGGYGRGGYGGFRGYGYGYGYYGLGLGYYDGLNPYYYGPDDYDYDAAPPQVVYAPPAATVQQGSPAIWYYCPVAKAYYPYVNVCPSGWQEVPASPPQQQPQPPQP